MKRYRAHWTNVARCHVADSGHQPSVLECSIRQEYTPSSSIVSQLRVSEKSLYCLCLYWSRGTPPPHGRVPIEVARVQRIVSGAFVRHSRRCERAGSTITLHYHRKIRRNLSRPPPWPGASESVRRSGVARYNGVPREAGLVFWPSGRHISRMPAVCQDLLHRARLDAERSRDPAS